MGKFKDDLTSYIDAGLPIIYVDTFEEWKVENALKTIPGKNIMEWSIYGFRDFATNTILSGLSLIATLKLLDHDLKRYNRRILILKDTHSFLSDPVLVAMLKRLSRRLSEIEGLEFNIVIISPVVIIPPELEKYVSLLSLDYLDQSGIEQVVNDFCDKQELELTPQFLEELSVALKGLTEYEIRNMLAIALSSTDKTLTNTELALIIEQKQQLIKKSGLLELVNVKGDLSSIGGLGVLKKWLRRKAIIFKNISQAEKQGVDKPKGVLIAGMPGCGKSLSAKAAAKLFDIPLLRMDIGRIMGKYVGESEANMRKAIQLAEAISPCVLWIDELEKAFAGVGGNSGASDVTTRLVGTFLTWLQEKDSMTFVVATANDISNMPAEFLRKGRFDEMFYVGLPNQEERKEIFEIHIRKRRPDALNNNYVDLDDLAGYEKTDGYSGADIEGVVKDSIEEVFVHKKELTTDDIKSAIDNTHSLKEVMDKEWDEIKANYEKRNFKKASE